ncbi:hypothetical protein QWY28_04855 [Nocardioides sp. SOB77]|uniref:Uncharacterized protein n=1 Tax=Nocardioides oceani TaxID=3058369 RepID=A0ABT8FCX6_9ACTN|nr:hypothetical protein [Nocardioides oceani]MDN4172262.1 hypothetical protein [Nocardioides oceani]
MFAELSDATKGKMAVMSLRPIKSLGTFHARQTRDGAALARDGQVYVLINELHHGRSGGVDEVEVLFEDGFWMLASRADLTPF